MPNFSESSALVSAGQLVRALYDYTAESADGKVLSISAGELFVVIKSTKPDEWLYAVSASGSLGYIPANFVRNQLVPDEEFLKLVEGILQRLESTTGGNIATARQVNHARVKLSHVRCEIAQRVHFERNSVSTLDDAAALSTSESVGAEDQGVQTSPSLIEKKEKDEAVSREEQRSYSYSDPLDDQERVEPIRSNRREDPAVDTTAEDHAHVLADISTSQTGDAAEEDAKPTDRSNQTEEGRETGKGEEEDRANLLGSAQSPIQLQPDCLVASLPGCHVTREPGSCCSMLGPAEGEEHEDDQKDPQTDLSKDGLDDEEISDQLASDLIEKVRACSELNHELCKTTIQVVVSSLGRAFPSWRNRCDRIVTRVQEEGGQFKTQEANADYERMQSIFRRLWSCQSDEQQRSWPVHEDETMIMSFLRDLTTLFADANPAVAREIINQRNYAHVQTLTTYFQMETRRSIRLQLYSVFLEIIRLNNSLVPDFFLTSVLPNCLAEEMLNHFEDPDRWIETARLFTVVFSTGHKPLNTLYDHLGERFISKMINLLERVDEEGNKVDTLIPSESSIPPILAFNLHFDSRDTNLVLRALKSRKTATELTENLVSYLNWGEDPTVMPKVVSSSAFEANRPNAVHKLLIEILGEGETAKLFYLNDVRVVVDIVITHLNNLTAGDRERLACLAIADRVLRNTTYLEEPHKPEQLLKCLNGILTNENSSTEEKALADAVICSMNGVDKNDNKC